MALIYFKVLLKTPPTYKDVGPPLAPPTALNNYKVRHSKVWKVIWLKSIEKMDILTIPDYFHVSEKLEFWYLYSLSKKEKGNYEKLDFIYVAVDKNLQK